MKLFFTFQDQLNVKLKISDNLKTLISDLIGPVFNKIHHFDFQAERYARIQGYWWKYSDSKFDGSFHHIWLRTWTNDDGNFRRHSSMYF